ncbi:hypothetical protein [Sphingomonas hankyongi]|nr:hypothetical protein [Sphingomonas hankyongi]
MIERVRMHRSVAQAARALQRRTQVCMMPPTMFVEPASQALATGR